MKKHAPSWIVFVSTLVLPGLALAHAGDTHAHFLQALAHPFTGADHLLAMVCVGLWGALRGGRQIWLAPLAFVASMAAGAALQSAGVALPGAEPMVAASVLVIGSLVVMHEALPAFSALGLFAAFALFHGVAHARELDVASALPGMLIGTAALHAVGASLGLMLRSRSRAWPMLIGSGSMAVGAALLLGAA